MKRFPIFARWAIPVAFALIAIAAWPAFVQNRLTASHAEALPAMSPVDDGYLRRDSTIRFWEGMVAKNVRDDMMSPRQLAEQYLQRYRERGDIGDVLRARSMAQRSLRAQPRGNVGAEVMLASVALTLHQFKEALAITHDIERWMPGDREMQVREASLDMELGDYADTKRILDRLGPGPSIDISYDTARARYLELTGRLSDARSLLTKPTGQIDATFEAPAQTRAWFHFRTGEMAFEAGDNDAALAEEDTALAIFPNYAEANRLKAKFLCALQRWQACLDAATASANVVPYPETLGYEADAQRALGDRDGARRTDDLIVTIEKIGNAQHISDRLLAIYYSEHGIHTHDAYRIARRELSVRDDIFTEDTLAWAAVADGRWNEARTAERKALAFDTENALLQYHAGVIAEHFGDRAAAKARFERALALNPSFHQVYAADARARVARL